MPSYWVSDMAMLDNQQGGNSANWSRECELFLRRLTDRENIKYLYGEKRIKGSLNITIIVSRQRES